MIPAPGAAPVRDAVTPRPHPSRGTSRDTSRDKDGVRALQVFVVVLFVFPADSILAPVGALGFPGGLVAMLLFGLWLVCVVMGLHDPRPLRTPVRSALCLFWLVSLISGATTPWAPGLTVAERASGDRWFMLLAGLTGVALVAAETLRDLDRITRVVRALVWSATFCAVVAVLQFYASVNIVPYLRDALPGFQLNGEVFVGQDRGILVRVAGTTSHPIELGVVSAMLIPLALWLGVRDSDRPTWRRWLPVLALIAAVTASVSRSAVLTLVIAMAVYVVILPPRPRLVALLLIPPALAGVFLTTPGFIGTFAQSASAGSSDASLTNRTGNYPFVLSELSHRPWFGTGGGTYIAENAFRIFDNQYLTVALTLGVVGVVALLVLLVSPAWSVLLTARRTTDTGERALAAALGGACLAGAFACATFDGFSFPVFAFVDALLLGLCGAVHLLIRGRTAATATPRTATVAPDNERQTVTPSPRRRHGNPVVTSKGYAWTSRASSAR